MGNACTKNTESKLIVDYKAGEGNDGIFFSQEKRVGIKEKSSDDGSVDSEDAVQSIKSAEIESQNDTDEICEEFKGSQLNARTVVKESGKSQKAHFTGNEEFISSSEVTSPINNSSHHKGVDEERLKYLVNVCENKRWGKRKLNFSGENFTLQNLSSDWFGGNVTLQTSLQTLVLSGSDLYSFPENIVMQFNVLKSLEIRQCSLISLPKNWDMPTLRHLDLSHNDLVEFPQQLIFEGMPELQHLNLCNNKIEEITLPKVFFLRKIVYLNLANNSLSYIPDRIEYLASLKVLIVNGNNISRISQQVCEMDLKFLDVALNPLIQPPIETCERGVSSMRRYYRCLELEELSRQKLILSVKSANKTKNDTKLLRGEIRRKKQKLRRGFPYLASRIHRHHSNDSNEAQTVATSSTGGTISVATPVNYDSEQKNQIFAKTQEAHRSLDANTPRQRPMNQTNILPSNGVNLEDTQRKKIGIPDVFEASDGDISRKRCSSEPMARVENVQDLRKSKFRKSVPQLFGEEMKSMLSDVLEVVPDISTLQESQAPSMEDTHYLSEKNDGTDDISVNDTLKIIFVGVANAGKTSIIKRLIDGEHAIIPSKDERTVGVDIYEWNPAESRGKGYHDVDTTIVPEDDLTLLDSSVNVKFSVWDFAGQHVYHAAQELFFSQRALYVLVWDMSATNPETKRVPNISEEEHGAFSLYDSSDDEDNTRYEEEIRKADRALLSDIDEKVQFWVDCIQNNAPGSAILPVASFDDYFEGDPQEAQRRCSMLKNRLQVHEQNRIDGLKERYDELFKNNAANSEAAERILKLISPLYSPNLIFGPNEESSVVRVSGSRYKGFDKLNERIISIATGRYFGSWHHSLFRGHVGARIPQMRLIVRGFVQSMRDKFKVVEWFFFLSALRRVGLSSDEDITDALHFLTDIGEISYFGSLENDGDSGLSQYIFLNPRWLVTAVSCILRHDIDNAILEAHRLGNKTKQSSLERSLVRKEMMYDAHLNCPVMTSEDACLLWQTKKVTKKAIDRVLEYSDQIRLTPYEFLQRLLIRFRVFVPIDLSIGKTELAGREFNSSLVDETCFGDIESSERISKFFFLPSLLGPGEPSEVWTYKTSESWKSIVCHSILFPESVPAGLMERVIATVLSTLYTVTQNNMKTPDSISLGSQRNRSFEISRNEIQGLKVKEILCWRSAFFLKITKTCPGPEGEPNESFVEIFVHLVDRDSNLCVASDSMFVGSRRLIVSGNGQVGDGGRKIWSGGYSLVKTAALRAVYEYDGLEFIQQGICPACLAEKPISQASTWSNNIIEDAAKNGEQFLRCSNCHKVSSRLVCGPYAFKDAAKETYKEMGAVSDVYENTPISDLSLGVVLVGLWDCKRNKILNIGSGFVVDRKKGLIVTAAHTLINLENDDEETPFGEDYYGLPYGKAVIGVIPRSNDAHGAHGENAVFRYFAQIVAKDENIDSKGICHMDACVLRITTRLEQDVGRNSESIGTTREIVLSHHSGGVKNEKLFQLRLSNGTCELDEQVRVLGFNQGGEGLEEFQKSYVDRSLDFAKGYVCKKYRSEKPVDMTCQNVFIPQEELVVICPTIGGHSGGPCVNRQGEVIGILSRVDPADPHRCYLVPSSVWKKLVKNARRLP